jgi:hypothetical protein
MIVPDKLMNPEPAFVLRVQNAVCEWEIKTGGCDEHCDLCVLNTGLTKFGEWLSKQVTEAQDA